MHAHLPSERIPEPDFDDGSAGSAEQHVGQRPSMHADHYSRAVSVRVMVMVRVMVRVSVRVMVSVRVLVWG